MTNLSCLDKRLDLLEYRLNTLDAAISYLYNEARNANPPAVPEQEELDGLHGGGRRVLLDDDFGDDDFEDDEDDDFEDGDGGPPATPWGGVLDAPVGARVVLWGTRPRRASAFAAFGPALAEGFIDGVVLDRIGGQLVVACGVDRCAVFDNGSACWLAENGAYTPLGSLRLTCIEPEDTPRVPDNEYQEGPDDECRQGHPELVVRGTENVRED